MVCHEFFSFIPFFRKVGHECFRTILQLIFLEFTAVMSQQEAQHLSQNNNENGSEKPGDQKISVKTGKREDCEIAYNFNERLNSKNAPSHQIRNIVEQAKQSTTVRILDDDEMSNFSILPTEISHDANLKCIPAEAKVVHIINYSQKSQIGCKTFKVEVNIFFPMKLI